MKSIKALIVLSWLLPVGCTTKTNDIKTEYQLIPDDDGIMVEKFDSTIIDENRFNQNNDIFKVGNSFKYDFEHRTTSGEIKYFKINPDYKGWDFADADDTDSLIVKSVVIQVLNGNPIAQFIPDYNQTALAYILIEGVPFSMSGAIENEANIWIHPPREHYFKILELNPFPYIKAPYEIGTKWNWNLTIGSSYADKRWKTWENTIENNYQYEITNKILLETPLGNLQCYVIESEAESRIGKTALTAYFHPKYGFVKLDYTNIDGSETKLELTKHLTNNPEN
ncbi:hypothetical protein SAMN05661096_02561 [Marivirga sericea]|uniref:Uncharacterized protein n=1 Tax=Marivirga sericea TaxID=1028 RepID=A0A1X7KBX0_9BACT|nr:hypothetical protein [Marivirga sericea]SMG38699.1 hypothetical protein SAMN05661096_02561 [Marivirga sericea]